MGSSGGSSQVVRAEETVTPAVAKDIGRNTESAAANQQQARSRLRGIRSTYANYAQQGGTGNGTRGTLG